jgi:micrococcal nuclease
MRFHATAVIATAVVVSAVVISPATAAAEPVAATATVLKVVDGDTIDIRDEVRGRLRVRILGIDTPETKQPGYSVGCWGPEATEFAKSNMVGQRVALETDPTQDRTDRFGRTLAYLVRADGWDYSVEAARAGTAHSYVYDVPVSRHAAIDAAEREARGALRGLWGPPCNGTTESVPR